MNERRIALGVVCQPIKDQILDQDLKIIDIDKMEILEKYRNAYNLLKINGLLSERESYNVGRRIVKEIGKNVKENEDNE
jgi:hypothetical protein